MDLKLSILHKGPIVFNYRVSKWEEKGVWEKEDWEISEPWLGAITVIKSAVRRRKKCQSLISGLKLPSLNSQRVAENGRISVSKFFRRWQTLTENTTLSTLLTFCSFVLSNYCFFLFFHTALPNLFFAHICFQRLIFHYVSTRNIVIFISLNTIHV